MAIYLIAMIVLFLFNVMAYQDKKLQILLYRVSLVVLFFLTAFRWEVGCDFMTYEAYGSDVAPGLSLEEAMTRGEPGYWTLAVLLDEGKFGWEWIDVFTAISFYAGLHSMARREANPLLFLTLAFPALIIGLAMSAVRQALAMGFVCYAFNAFADKNRVRYIVCILIAGLFHKSALALLGLAPFLFPGSIQVKIVIGVLAAAPMAYVMSRSEAAETYTSMYVNSGIEAGGGRFRVIPVGITGAIFMLWLRKKWQETYPRDYERMLFFAPLLVATVPLVFISSVMGDRFGYYLMPLAFSIQTRAYMLLRPQYAFMAFLAPLVHCLVYMGVWIFLSSLFWQCYVPYKTWWFST
jgi:hypothetical protein